MIEYLKGEIRMGAFYTYMLRCEDDSIYTGFASDIDKRLEEHFSKGRSCAKYTRAHGAKKLDALWMSAGKSAAMRLEALIKGLRRVEKERLIEKNDFGVFNGRLEGGDYERVL